MRSIGQIALVEITDTYIVMDKDLVFFFAGVAFLILYLVFSALTEMGTKLPWKK